MPRGAYLLDLRQPVPYAEAWDLQRSVAAAVSQGAMPETVILLEHPPVVTLGRRTDGERELHVPDGAAVEVVETDRGGKSTFHGPGQLVAYPVLDLRRHGKDVKRYVRDLERAVVATLAEFGIEGTTIEGLTGVWLHPHRYASGLAEQTVDVPVTSSPEPLRRSSGPPRKIASIGVRVARWVTTHGYALNVDLDPAPFTEWITACGLEDAAFTTMARELGRPLSVDEVRAAAAEALADVFDLALEPIPAEDGHGLWPQPVHARMARA